MDYMLKNSPSIILFDDVLVYFVGEGCGRTKDGLGNFLGN